jgi:two-component system chemotaxis response regulator CheY
VRAIARRTLKEGLNFVVDEAVDGQAGLVACRRFMPTAILLDWNMPILNGIDFLRALRAAEGGSAPVVVFCTTENDVRHITDAFNAGANEYIIKPFDSDMLRKKLATVGLV